MPGGEDKEQLTEQEIEEEAGREAADPLTSREALEGELMDEGRSEAGEHIPRAVPAPDPDPRGAG